jgi:tRNA pseudouridine38-40 synthase
MPRYFIEVAYKGTHYSGFQIQQNAPSVQAAIEKALFIFYKQEFKLTGSSRTDAGVHALQNYFHFNSELELIDASYHLNAILPFDIVVKKIFKVQDNSHCRFDALYREYRYYVFNKKDPFLQDRAYFFPYPVEIDLLQQAAKEIRCHKDFAAFSKRNTQNKTTICNIFHSEWVNEEDVLYYTVRSNRFLRGMVRGMVGTMLLAGRKKITIDQFRSIIVGKDCSKADFSVPPQGLFLQKVQFPSF